MHRITLPALAFALAACGAGAEPPAAPADSEWSRFADDALGLSFEYPAGWIPDVRGNTISVRSPDGYEMRATLAPRDEAVRRGLWGRTPLIRVDTVGGLSFAFYRYRHYDGPLYVPTLAFVVGHRGRELGLEFRSRAQELGPVERRILESLRLR